MSCNCAKRRSALPARVSRAIPAGDLHTVIIQPAGVIEITCESGRVYRIRNIRERIRVNPEDVEELRNRGYIAPQE